MTIYVSCIPVSSYARNETPKSASECSMRLLGHDSSKKFPRVKSTQVIFTKDLNA